MNKDKFQQVKEMVKSNSKVIRSILSAVEKGLDPNCPRLDDCHKFPCDT